MQIIDKNNSLLQKAKDISPELYDMILSKDSNFEQITSSATHDIRNYVSALYGILQIAESKNSDIVSLELWKQFNKTIHLLIDYLNTTSEYRYSMHIEKKEMDILDILWNIPDYIDDMYDAIGEEHTRNYTFDFPQTLPNIEGDFARLKAALIAITRNAVEATTEDDEINLSAYIDDNMLCITITDCGSGIDYNLLDKLGSAFITTKPSHAGVGLATALRTATAHGGGLFVNPQLIGTSVTLSIPI